MAGEIIFIAFNILTTTIYLLIAREVWKRPITKHTQKGRQAFVYWWLFLGIATLLGALMTSAHVIGVPVSLSIFKTYLHIAVVLIVAALYYLTYYLFFVYWGHERHMRWLVLAYILIGVYTLFVVNFGNPVGTEYDEQSHSLQAIYENDIESHPLGIVMGLVLIAPALLSAVLYGKLYFKATNRDVKIRIATVSLAIIIWFGASLLGNIPILSSLGWWPIFVQTLGLLSSSAVLVVYMRANKKDLVGENEDDVPGIEVLE